MNGVEPDGLELGGVDWDGVDWDGAINARRIAGDIYRMGRREWLSSKGWQQAYNDGVRTVVDLRSPSEIGRRPTDPVVEHSAFAGMAILSLPLEDLSNGEYKELCQPYMNHPAYYADVLRLFPRQVADIFSALALAEGAVLMHCSAGRDRTGLVATLLLALIGRPAEGFEQDQLAVRGINNWRLVAPTKHPYEFHMDDSELSVDIAERARSLAVFMENLDVRAYLMANGLSTEQLDVIVERCR